MAEGAESKVLKEIIAKQEKELMTQAKEAKWLKNENWELKVRIRALESKLRIMGDDGEEWEHWKNPEERAGNGSPTPITKPSDGVVPKWRME